MKRFKINPHNQTQKSGGRKMKKKVLSVVMAAAMMTSVFSATAVTASAADAEELTIWVHETDSPEGQLYKTLIDEFNKEYEGTYHATLTQIARSGDAGGYDDKVNAAITNGGLPDVFTVDGVAVAQYADANAIVPIGDYFKEDELADFNPSIIQQGTYNDELYTLGTSESSVLLFYNEKMLNEAGITPPTTLEEAWTWEDVYEAAKKLNKDGVYGIDLNWDLGEGQIYGLAPIVWSSGAELLSKDGKVANGYINSPEAVEALTYYQKFATEGLMNLQPLPNEFEEGKAAMYLMGSWEFTKLNNDYPDFEYGVTYYPASAKTKKVVSPSGDWCWGVTSGSENQEGAAELVKFLTNKDSVKEYCDMIDKPASRISVLESNESYNEYPRNILKDQVTKTAHTRPLTTSYPVLSKEFSSAMQDIRTGADVKSALDKVVQRFEEDIKRNN